MQSAMHTFSRCALGLASKRSYTSLRPMSSLSGLTRAPNTQLSRDGSYQASISALGVSVRPFSRSRAILDEDSKGSEWKGRDVVVPKNKARLDDSMIEDILLTFDENDNDASDDDDAIPKGKTQRMEEELEQANAQQGSEPNLEATEALSSNPLTYVNPKTGEIGGPRGPEPVRYGDWEVKGRCSDF